MRSTHVPISIVTSLYLPAVGSSPRQTLQLVRVTESGAKGKHLARTSDPQVLPKIWLLWLKNMSEMFPFCCCGSGEPMGTARSTLTDEIKP